MNKAMDKELKREVGRVIAPLQAKPRTGRPPKPPGTRLQDKKTTVLQVRLVEEEKAKLELHARNTKLSASDIIRGFISLLPSTDDIDGLYGTFPITVHGHRVLVTAQNAVALIYELAEALKDRYGPYE